MYVKSEMNVSRAGWAESAIEEFAHVTRTGPVDMSDAETREEVITDLLCDILHYAQQYGHDVNVLQARAAAGFEIESGGEI